MYKVEFKFRNEDGELVETYLDNNGDGFTYTDAQDLASTLRYKGNVDVTVRQIGGYYDD